MAGGKQQAGCTFAGCYAVAVIVIFCGSLTVAFMGGGGTSSAFGTPKKDLPVSEGELSPKIPPNYAKLFKQAGAAFNIDPAVIVAIYMTEHHIDKFTTHDLKSLDAVESGCSSNSSGARGPMQIIGLSWTQSLKNKLKDKGISNPDRCRYKDAFFAGASIIKGKLTGQPDTRKYCNITKKGLSGWTDNCLKAVGRAYCGQCGVGFTPLPPVSYFGDRSAGNCGRNGYSYCNHTLATYKYAKGNTAFVPYYLLEGRDQLCLLPE